MSEAHGFMAKSAPVKKGIAKLEAELAQAWRDIESLPVVELAARNSSVADYVKHWEGRATAAEALNAELVGAQRKPLTDEEVRKCCQAMDAEPLAEGWPELIKFARAIERAHGIGGSKPSRTVTYVCPVCAASLEREE